MITTIWWPYPESNHEQFQYQTTLYSPNVSKTFITGYSCSTFDLKCTMSVHDCAAQFVWGQVQKSHLGTILWVGWQPNSVTNNLTPYWKFPKKVHCPERPPGDQMMSQITIKYNPKQPCLPLKVPKKIHCDRCSTFPLTCVTSLNDCAARFMRR